MRELQPNENGNTGIMNEAGKEYSNSNLVAKQDTLSTLLKAITKRTKEQVSELMVALKNSTPYQTN